VTAKGNPGHASAFVKNTAGEKLNAFTNKVLNFRKFEESRLEKENFDLGDVTTVNWTIAKGGVQGNVVPAELMAVFDFRISPKFHYGDFETMVENWAREVDEEFCDDNKTQIKFIQKNTHQECSNLENKFIKNVIKSFNELKIKTKFEVFPAGTDARYLRAIGIPCLGFSPMINEEILLHDHNERLNEKTFLDGIEIYKKIIENLASVDI